MYEVHHRGVWYPIGAHIRILRPSSIYQHAIIVGGSLVPIVPVMVIDNVKGLGVSRRTLDEVAAVSSAAQRQRI